VAIELEQRSVSVLQFGRSKRRPELDALRGLFLVWMTLTHLPTHLSDYFNQPLGFVSSAEGFVFLSALLVAHLYFRQAAEKQERMREKLWKRSLHIYGYHVMMLVFAFTIAASLAAHTHRPALINLLNFYFAHPLTAIAGSLLLIYCPPLLDILPMYVVFMLLTPPVLIFATRRRWTWILAASGFIWLLAQYGLRSWIHSLVVRITGLQIAGNRRLQPLRLADRVGSGAVDRGLFRGGQIALLAASSLRLSAQHIDLPFLYRCAALLVWPSTHPADLQPSARQVADRPAAIIESHRLCLRRVLAAKNRRALGLGGALPHPWQSLP